MCTGNVTRLLLEASHIRYQGCYVFTYTVVIGSQFSGPAVTLYWSDTERASLCLCGDVCHCLYMNQLQVWHTVTFM